MHKQRGLTLISTLIVGVFIVMGILLGLKLVPVYTEFFAIKKAMNAVVRDTPGDAPIGSFRSAFERYADVDDIRSVTPSDLVIERDSGSVAMSVEYQRKVPLIANFSLLVDFSVSTR